MGTVSIVLVPIVFVMIANTRTGTGSVSDIAQAEVVLKRVRARGAMPVMNVPFD